MPLPSEAPPAPSGRGPRPPTRPVPLPRPTLRLATLLATATLTACASDAGGDAIDGDAGLDAGTDVGADTANDATTDAGAPALADRVYGDFTPWADPLADYHEAAGAVFDAFMRGVHDLAVFDDAMWIAYGDANVNVGREVPVEIRRFGAPDDPVPESVFTTDEEQIERFRVVGDLLLAPGVDATEDAWLGNVYALPTGGSWAKHRTVPEGVHVHDVAGWDGALWAVGSGSEPDEWDAGTIYAQLWTSTDDARTWDVVGQRSNDGDGDARWVHLLPTDDALWLFGYGSDAMGSIDEIGNATWDGASWSGLPADHPLAAVFVVGTWPVPGGGLVAGVDATTDPLRTATWFVADSGDVARIGDLDGRTLRDAFVDGDDVALVTTEGDLWGVAPANGRWAVRTWAWHPDAVVELTRGTMDAEPRAIAVWDDLLFIADADGGVARALPLP